MSTTIPLELTRKVSLFGNRLVYVNRGRGRPYPEQGQRQALRQFRCAQGGPGIELVDGKWQPRQEGGAL